MINTISFQHNWNNKLDNIIFTTIRSDKDDKYKYYYSNLNKVFSVMLDDKEYCKARLIGIESKLLDHIMIPLLMVDTGAHGRKEAMEVFQHFGLKEDSKALILVFKKE